MRPASGVLLAAGLIGRYLLRRPRLGAALLVSTMVADLILLAASVIDLRAGAVATSAHALAAFYLGFSVAFGPSTIRWADGWFAYRFAGGLRPPRRYGSERTIHEQREVAKAMLAAAIAAALLLAIALVGDASRTAGLSSALAGLPVVLGIWALIAASYTIWPTRRGSEAGRNPV